MSSGKLPITHVARLARLDLTSSEAALFEQQLDPILAMIDKLREIDFSNEDTTPVPPDGLPPLRDDAPVPGLDNAAALSNAPAKARGQIMVPRVIDAE